MHLNQLSTGYGSKTSNDLSFQAIAFILWTLMASFLLGGCRGGSDDSEHRPSPPQSATSLQVTPAHDSLPAGLSLQLTAQAVMENGVVIDVTNAPAMRWESSNPTVANVDNHGVVTAIEKGDVVVRGIYPGVDGELEASAHLLISDAEATSVQLTYASDTTAAGISLPLFATAFFSDGTSMPVTEKVQWTSDNPDVAAFNADRAGVLETYKSGATVVSATLNMSERRLVFDFITVIVTNAEPINIQLTPAESVVAKGRMQSYEATLVLSDGSVESVTKDDRVTWTVSNPDVAELEGPGSVKALQHGDTLVTAHFFGAGADLQQQAKLAVSEAELLGLELEAEKVELAAGLTQQLRAWASFSDGSRKDVTFSPDLHWQSDDIKVATVGSINEQKGYVTAVAPGDVTIIASLVENTTASHTAELKMKVTAATPVSLTVSPELVSVAAGSETQFIATVKLSDGSTDNVTGHSNISWETSDKTVAVVNNHDGAQGLVKTHTAGHVKVYARFALRNGESLSSNKAELDVTDAVVVGLRIEPNTPSFPAGVKEQFTVYAIFSDQSETDLTDHSQLSWSSSNSSVATVSSSGLVVGIKAGSTKIKAAYRDNGVNVDSQVELQVTSAFLVSIELSPPYEIVMKGLDTKMKAKGTFSDGKVVDITEDDKTSWNTELDSVVNIVRKGQFSGVSVGEADLTVHYDSVDVKAKIKVVDAPLAIDWSKDCGESVTPLIAETNTFTCPLSSSSAERVGLYVDEVVNSNVKFFEFRVNNLCALFGGVTPSFSDLAMLFNSHGNISMKSGWSVDSIYWTSSEKIGASFRDDAIVAIGPLFASHSLTCIVNVD